MLVALVLPILLALAAFIISLSYVQIARSGMQIAVDNAALAAGQEICDMSWSTISLASGCGSRFRWNSALDAAVAMLAMHKLHASLGQSAGYEPLSTEPFHDVRNRDDSIPTVPEWRRGDLMVRINRGWINKGKFESLEGADWDARHPGVLKYLLFSAIKVEVTRRIGMFAWLGIGSWTVSVESMGVLPNEDVLVAPFALPQCAVLDITRTKDGELPTEILPPDSLCEVDRIFGGTSQAGTFSTPGCSGQNCCPPEGCLAMPEFGWTPDLCWNPQSEKPPGACNWGAARYGRSAADKSGLLTNFGLVGLPLTDSVNPQGYYHDFDPVLRPSEIYLPPEVHEGTIKDIINGLHGGVPLVHAGLGWRFAALPDGLEGAMDSSPGGRIDDAVWNQINKVPPGSAADPRCGADVPASICSHPNFLEELLFPLTFQLSYGCTSGKSMGNLLGWESSCPGSAMATQGLCRSRRYQKMTKPSSTFIGTYTSDCVVDGTTPSGSMWQALVPILADVRADPDGALKVNNTCVSPLDTSNLSIVSFARVNFIDVDINNGLYPVPTSCGNEFRNPGDVSADLSDPPWGFSSSRGLGCNVVRGRISCRGMLSASAASAGSFHPSRLQLVTD